MIAAFKRMFRRTTPIEIASRELVESELYELTYQSNQEYAAAMVTYHQNKTVRLRKFVGREVTA